MNKRSKVIVGIVLGFAVVFLIIWMSPIGRFILAGGLSTDEQPFNSEQWKAVKNEAPSAQRIRIFMIEDLVENKLQNGLDSVAVKEMLGEPERKYGFSYPLGELTPGIDPFFLILTFDKSGKLSERTIESENKLKKQ